MVWFSSHDERCCLSEDNVWASRSLGASKDSEPCAGHSDHSIVGPGRPRMVMPVSVVSWPGKIFQAGHAQEIQRCSRPSSIRCRSEEHTSELQSLMRNSYAVFCLKKKKTTRKRTPHDTRVRRQHNQNEHT